MVKPERTGNRESDLIYSTFHRSLPPFCYMSNLDSVEWRAERGIVAFIETAIRDQKQTLSQQIDTKKFEAKLLLELQYRTKIPSFIVFHNLELTTFQVFKVTPEIESKMYLWKVLNQVEYKQFIKNL